MTSCGRILGTFIATCFSTSLQHQLLRRFFYLIQLVVLLDVTGCFAKRSGHGRLHVPLICDTTCTSTHKWNVSDIYIRSTRFSEIVLFRLRNKKSCCITFFLFDTSNLFLFEICSYLKPDVSDLLESFPVLADGAHA